MEEPRLRESLRRLRPHVDPSRVALTGGVAIGSHLGVGTGLRAADIEAHDIDFVATSPDAVRASATTDFLVSHFHLPQPGYSKFLIQLVDPVSRLRIDIFPDSGAAISRALTRKLADVSFLVLEPTEILDHKLATLAKASAERPDDPKHLDDAVRLATLCGRVVPQIHSAHLRPAEFSRDVDAKCSRCEHSRSDAFPLAAKEAIMDILGYL